MTEPEVGQTFGRYQLESVLGQGGMGKVFRALDTVLKRRVALKIVLHGGPGTEGAARLVREAQAAAALAHPGAVQVFDVGEHDGVAFIAMELVEGVSLRARLLERPDVKTIVGWLAETAAALAAAHDLGLVHRDVKPDNVMIRASDGRAKVLDFGIARRAAAHVDPSAPTATPDHLATLTGEGIVVGTPAYMSPEQLHSEPLDGRSDQFAWGVLAYEALAGELPWGPPTEAVKLVAAILAKDPPSLADKAPGLPPAVATTIARALAKTRDDRFPSMHDVVAALGPGAETTPRSGNPALAPTVAAPALARGPRVAWGLAAMGALGVVVFAAARSVAPPSDGRVAPSASASASAASPDGGDLPSCHNDAATAALREGVRIARTRSNALAAPHFDKALELDSGCASVHVERLTAYGWGPDPKDFLAAKDRKEQLAPAQRALVDALQPLYETPQRPDEAKRLLAQAMARFPGDVGVGIEAARQAVFRGDLDDADAAASALAKRHPTLLAARSIRMNVASERGDHEGALRQALECHELAPFAGLCANPARMTMSALGRCEELERFARGWIAAYPEHPGGHIALANALAWRGEPYELVVDVTARAASLSKRVSEDVATTADVAFWAGRFETAIAGYDKIDAACSDDAHCHLWALWPKAVALLEMGRVDDAVKLAKAIRVRSPGWSGDAEDTAVLLSNYVALLVEHDKLPKSEILGTGRPRPDTWRAATALVPQTIFPTAARVVAELLPTTAPPPELSGRFLGFALAAAGRDDEAVRALEDATRTCDVLSPHFAHARSLLLLGDLRKKRGDAAGARAAWGAIVRQWGKATPRSVTAEAAKKRLAGLGP